MSRRLAHRSSCRAAPQIYPTSEGGPFLNADDGSSVVGYDGVAVIDYASREDWQALSGSNDWKTIAGPDNANCESKDPGCKAGELEERDCEGLCR